MKKITGNSETKTTVRYALCVTVLPEYLDLDMP